MTTSQPPSAIHITPGPCRARLTLSKREVVVASAEVGSGDKVTLEPKDADGVLVIPRAHEEAVLAAAEEIDAIEQQIRAAINDGKTLLEARRLLGYHQLQSRRK